MGSSLHIWKFSFTLVVQKNTFVVTFFYIYMYVVVGLFKICRWFLHVTKSSHNIGRYVGGFTFVGIYIFDGLTYVHRAVDLIIIASSRARNNSVRFVRAFVIQLSFSKYFAESHITLVKAGSSGRSVGR